MEEPETTNEIEVAPKRKWRQRFIEISQSRRGLVFISFIAFIESAFFPIPPDFLIVPVVAAKPSSWKKFAFWVSLFSILGAFLGYFIGSVLYETIGHIIIEKYSLTDEMARIGDTYERNAFWSLVIAAFTPIPFKVFTIAAGVFKVDLVAFTLASIIGRGARYVLVPYLAAVGGSAGFWRYLRGLRRTTWVAVGVVIVVTTVIWLTHR